MCAQPAKQSITIKKYANRRLYNTATSSYVTLEDLSEMVKEGNQFNVYDAKTSEDITRSVLTQIIVEEESKEDQQNLLPISFLRQLIGFYGDSLQWMVPKYLEHSMEMLTGKQDQIREYFQTSLGNMFPFGTTLEEMSKQNMAMFENTLRMFSPMNAFENIQNPFAMMANNMLAATSNTTNPVATTNALNVTTNAATSCCTNTKNQKPKADTSCATNASCSISNKTNDSNTTKATQNTMTQPMASVTNLKPRNTENNMSAAPSTNTVTTPTPASTTNATTTTTTATNTTTSTMATTTPMPNVQNVTSNNNTDDMQQKIANLQRQLADLAKSRA